MKHFTCHWIFSINADADFERGEMFHTATAYLTFVAIGSNGKPSPMPPLILKNADDERRFAEGKKRRELRLANRKKR
jgi:acyl-CoA hydrolase